MSDSTPFLSDDEREISRLAGTEELRSFIEEMEARAYRAKHPPKWDLLGRHAVWALRLERALVDEDPAARRWLKWTVPLRLTLGIAVLLWATLSGGESFSVVDQLMGAFTGVLIAVWAMLPWQRAQAYESGYRRAELESHSTPGLF